jgi:broad specificity phosphatase PhoE
MSTPTGFLVLRHGQSEWNAARRWQGQADIDLTETGREQARRAAERLHDFDVIACSDLGRARVTAEIIATVTGATLLDADPRLRETHVGEWQGLTHDEIEAGWPGYLASHRRPPGFENDDVIVRRVTEAFADLAGRHPGGNVLVISHAGVLRVMRRALRVVDRRIANLGGSRFTVWPGSDGAHHRVEAGELVDLVEHGETGEEL